MGSNSEFRIAKFIFKILRKFLRQNIKRENRKILSNLSGCFYVNLAPKISSSIHSMVKINDMISYTYEKFHKSWWSFTEIAKYEPTKFIKKRIWMTKNHSYLSLYYAHEAVIIISIKYLMKKAFLRFPQYFEESFIRHLYLI